MQNPIEIKAKQSLNINPPKSAPVALRTVFRGYHIVREGQTLRGIAEYYSVSAYALAALNELRVEPLQGTVLKIPSERGNAYYAQPSDTPTLLCGSAESYARKNGVGYIYPNMLTLL